MHDNTDEPVQTEEEMENEAIRAKIIHLLKIYPVISHTMLQGGLGPSLKPAFWRPILMELIEEGVVIESQESLITPTDRYNSYTKLSLAGTIVSHANDS